MLQLLARALRRFFQSLLATHDLSILSGWDVVIDSVDASQLVNSHAVRPGALHIERLLRYLNRICRDAEPFLRLFRLLLESRERLELDIALLFIELHQRFKGRAATVLTLDELRHRSLGRFPERVLRLRRLKRLVVLHFAEAYLAAYSEKPLFPLRIELPHEVLLSHHPVLGLHLLGFLTLVDRRLKLGQKLLVLCCRHVRVKPLSCVFLSMQSSDKLGRLRLLALILVLVSRFRYVAALLGKWPVLLNQALLELFFAVVCRSDRAWRLEGAGDHRLRSDGYPVLHLTDDRPQVRPLVWHGIKAELNSRLACPVHRFQELIQILLEQRPLRDDVLPRVDLTFPYDGCVFLG